MNAYELADDLESYDWYYEHELTHAILHDMKNKLSYDEKFVVAFSQRLDQAIKTARF